MIRREVIDYHYFPIEIGWRGCFYTMWSWYVCDIESGTILHQIKFIQNQHVLRILRVKIFW